jgi:hypothetical protein
MMKTFTKTFDRCNDCPAVGYVHFDGEGESCAYQYYHAVCTRVNKDLPWDHIVKKTYEESSKEGYVPERRIPIWCPLSEGGAL